MLRGSSPTDFMRLKVSRQEIPASTRMRALELSTTAVLPRLPLASTDIDTPIFGRIHSLTVELGVTFRLSAELRQERWERRGDARKMPFGTLPYCRPSQSRSLSPIGFSRAPTRRYRFTRTAASVSWNAKPLGMQNVNSIRPWRLNENRSPITE